MLVKSDFCVRKTVVLCRTSIQLIRTSSSDFYFFFDAFLDLPLALEAFAPLAGDLVLFFFPKADAQLLLYRLLGPLRKMVIGFSDKSQLRLIVGFDWKRPNRNLPMATHGLFVNVG